MSKSATWSIKLSGMSTTFIFEEVAHTRPPGKNELGDVFDDLGFVFGRESGKPFGEALLWEVPLALFKREGGRRGTHNFPLPREEDEIAEQASVIRIQQRDLRPGHTHLMAIPAVQCGARKRLLER